MPSSASNSNALADLNTIRTRSIVDGAYDSLDATKRCRAHRKERTLELSRLRGRAQPRVFRRWPPHPPLSGAPPQASKFPLPTTALFTTFLRMPSTLIPVSSPEPHQRRRCDPLIDTLGFNRCAPMLEREHRAQFVYATADGMGVPQRLMTDSPKSPRPTGMAIVSPRWVAE